MLQDKQSNSAVHLAAQHGGDELLPLLLQGQTGLLQVRNNDGQLPLHVAAKSGCKKTALVLLKSDPATARMGDRRGLRAAQLAARSGHQVHPCADGWPSIYIHVIVVCVAAV